MKTPPNQTAFESAPDKANVTTNRFRGTENPRFLRALGALVKGEKRREQLDVIAGCSNGPQLVAELRRIGLEVPCKFVDGIDRDGRPIKRGVYWLTEEDRKKLEEWPGYWSLILTEGCL
jgi:hypothetical protein